MPDSPQQRSHGYARSGAGFGRQCRWCITVVASCRTRSQFSCSSWCSKHSQLINNVTHRDTDYTITTAAGEHPASSITEANSGGLRVTPRSPSAAGTRSSGADGRLEIHARREPLGASEPVTGELREPPRWVVASGPSAGERAGKTIADYWFADEPQLRCARKQSARYFYRPLRRR
jgi:hypothetical protein